MIRLEQSSKDYAIIYHWWNDDVSVKPHTDITNPVILAITTLRAHNKNIPVYILDVSKSPKHDWEDYPEKLNFEVIPWLPLMNKEHSCSRLCSRVWDIWHFAKTIKQHKIIFTDSDVFWLNNPLPLMNEIEGRIDYFNCASNTGVWYFDRRSELARKTINTWKSIIMLALMDEDFLKQIQSKVPTARGGLFQDEIAFGYLILEYPELYRPVHIYENFVIDGLRHSHHHFEKIKCLHALKATLGEKRGNTCLFLKELHDAIKSVLTEGQIEGIFGKAKSATVSIHDIHKMSRDQLLAFLAFTGNSQAYVPEKYNRESYMNWELFGKPEQEI
jgi:hypothetical protein